MASNAYIGRAYMPSQALVIGAQAETTTAGHYYLAGYDLGVTDVGLVEHLEDVILATTGDPYPSATVVLSLTTGKVTIDFSTTGTLDWTDTALRDALGFTGNLAAASSYTGANVARHLWLPSREPADYPLDRALVWDDESNTRTIRSSDGTSFAVKGPGEAGRAEIAYRYLTLAETVRTADPGPGTAEQLWRDTGAAGQPVRYLPDTGSYAATTDYVTGLWDMEDGEKSFTTFATRAVPGSAALWDVRVPLVEYSG